jgi:hypothetical protein
MTIMQGQVFLAADDGEGVLAGVISPLYEVCTWLVLHVMGLIYLQGCAVVSLESILAAAFVVAPIAEVVHR